ncbi:hypothetical protein KAU45_05790, partial [bacterium]|nr:hypothetical protein [bacterium]
GGLFGGMPRGRGAWYAFLYAGLILFISAVLTTLVQLFIRGGSVPWHILLNVLGLAGLLLLDTAALLALGRLYNGRLPFPDVLRVVSYSATAYIFLIVPIFGPLLVLALILVYLTLGSLRGLHLGVVQSVSLALLPLAIRLAAAWLIYGDRFIQLVAG